MKKIHVLLDFILLRFYLCCTQLSTMILNNNVINPTTALVAQVHTAWQMKVDVVAQLEKELTEQQKKVPQSMKGRPCEASLDPVLKRHNVVRQEYHGGAFIGNHVAKALTPQVVDELTSAPLQVVQDRCASLVPEMDVVTKRYELLLKEYAACRSIFNTSSAISDADLTTLTNNIATFLASVRREIVTRQAGNITPKLHLLEDHVVPQMRAFGVGLALHGEQGGESIHHEWNEQESKLRGTTDELERLKQVMKSHTIGTLPSTLSHKPTIARRHRKDN